MKTTQLASVQKKIMTILELLKTSQSPFASGTFIGIYYSALANVDQMSPEQLNSLDQDLSDALTQLK